MINLLLEAIIITSSVTST